MSSIEAIQVADYFRAQLEPIQSHPVARALLDCDYRSLEAFQDWQRDRTIITKDGRALAFCSQWVEVLS